MKSTYLKSLVLGLSLLFLSSGGLVSDFWPQPVLEQEKVLGLARELNNEGVKLYQNLRLEEALANFVLAAEIDHDFWQGHYNCAVVLGAMGKTQEALHHLELSLKVNPHNAMAFELYRELLNEASRAV